MISAAWDWYYGSQDEELLADCEFGEPYSTKRCSSKDVCMRPATLNSGLQVTVFTQVKMKPKEITDLEKCSSVLKVLRHPNILRHIGIVATETEVHLVTERVSPLYLKFETADANEVSSGVYDIAQALLFLHEKAKLTHNIVSIESIYITEGGGWKLGNFESACPFLEATAPFLKQLKRLNVVIPPEESDNMVAFPIEANHGHCRDVYALGILLGLFSKQARFASEVQSQEIQDLLEELLQKDFRSRPKVSDLLDSAVLSSEYIEIVNFLQSVTLKSNADKRKFFSNLIPRLKTACISDELIAKRIAKLLLSPVILSENDAVEKVLPRLLTPIPLRLLAPSQGLISECMFARYVIPVIVDLLEVKILHVRLVLIDNFHRYVHMFEKSVLQDAVLPEILLGLHDSNNQLVKASLHALADSVPIVGGDMIVGAEREKIFGFGMPKFNGSVLVDASSLAYEMKPKRKPKKPPKKPTNRPVTLLELAMRRQRSPAKGMKAQRDLMLLKQNELSMSLVAPQTNGKIPHSKVEAAKVEVSAPSLVNTPSTSPPLAKTQNPVAKLGDSSTVNSASIAEENSETNRKETREPEIETWAGSESENETWDDFDAFGNDGTKHAEKDKTDITLDAGDGTQEAKKTSEHGSSLSGVIDGGASIEKSSDRSTKTKDSAASQMRQMANSSPKNVLDLGTEFEISVAVKAAPTISEPDFFADMTPDIPTREIPVLSTAQNIFKGKKRTDSEETESTAPSTKSSPISVSFAAADSADDEATDGWENDVISWDD